MRLHRDRDPPLGTVESDTEVICCDMASCEMPFTNACGLSADERLLYTSLKGKD